MGSRKFMKKKDQNPKRELFLFFLILFTMIIGSIYLIRYKISTEKPFIASSTKQLGYLDFKMEFDTKGSYREGQPVNMKMFLKNISDKQLEITFPYSVEVDFLVFREDDWIFFKVPTLVWSYAIAQKSYEKPHTLTLKPGETKVFAAEWPQEMQDGSPAKPGNYNIIGKIHTTDFSISLSLRGKSE